MMTFPIATEHAAPVRGPRQGDWTGADWERLDHNVEDRYEIIDGVLYVSTSPSLYHQYVLRRCVTLLGTPIEQQGLGEFFFAPIGLFMPGCDPVQPDFVFVGKDKTDILRDRRIYGVPDLIIEIVSPGNVAYDEETKLAAYETAGVPEYAIVYPMTRSLRLYRLNADSVYDDPLTFPADASLAFACLPTLTFRVGALFDGAPDTTL